MERLNTSKGMSRVFRGLVLALAVVLVACGSDSDESDPTATADSGQEAAPTAPPLDSTPDTTVSEEDITVLDPQIPATAESSTPDVTEEVAEAEIVSEDPNASPPSTPEELTTESDAATVTADAADPEIEDVLPASDATAEPEGDVATEGQATAVSETESAATPEIATVVDSTPEATERPTTGNETFTNPGDGTGGSGMPGERDSNEESDEAPAASPEASPIAQLEISGCEVPDVPGFLGESNIFELTAEVNFRSGPGINCDPLLDEPIGEGQIVVIVGGPVTQTEDGSEWVLIEVEGQSGWITNDFLEPTE